METTSIVNRMPECDIRVHIEDEPLCWVFRDGRNQRLAWNELTKAEQEQIEEAQRREYFSDLFEIYEEA